MPRRESQLRCIQMKKSLLRFPKRFDNFSPLIISNNSLYATFQSSFALPEEDLLSNLRKSKLFFDDSDVHKTDNLSEDLS